MRKLEDISIEIEKTYQELEKTVDEINSLKGQISKISTATNDLVSELKELSQNEGLANLNKERNQIAKSIRQDIIGIKEHIAEIEIFRKYFQDSMESYNKRSHKDLKQIEEESSKFSDSAKALAKITSSIRGINSENNKSRKRITEIASEIDLHAHYKEVKQEQKEQRKLLEAILKSISNNK